MRNWVLLLMMFAIVVFCMCPQAAAQDTTKSVMQAKPAVAPQTPQVKEVPAPATRAVAPTVAVVTPVVSLAPIGYIRTMTRPTLFGWGTVTRSRFIRYRPVTRVVVVRQAVIQPVFVQPLVARPVYSLQPVITGYTYGPR